MVAMEAILDNLQVSNDDRSCLFAICLLDGMISNNGNNIKSCLSHDPDCLIAGVERTLLEQHQLLSNEQYYYTMVTKLLNILETSTKSDNYVRLVTMAMCIKLLEQILDLSKDIILIDEHLAQLEVM